MATPTTVGINSSSKFTCTFEHTLIEAKHKTQNGNEIEFQLEKLSNYYQILKIPNNVDKRFLYTKLKSEIPTLKHLTNQAVALKYLEMFSILIYYREFYDTYLCIAQFLEGIMSNRITTTTYSLKQCLDTISALISEAEKRTTKFVLKIQLSPLITSSTTTPSQQQNQQQLTTNKQQQPQISLFSVPHELYTALISAKYVCKKLYKFSKQQQQQQQQQQMDG